MAKDPLDEMIQFLKPQSRIDLKHIALDHLLGLSGSEDGINVLLKNEKIIQCVLELTNDKVDEISKNALLLLVNVTANPIGASELLKYKPNMKNVVEIFIGYVLDQHKKDADAVCMILSNITRQEKLLEVCLDIYMPHMNDLLSVFVNLDYNKKGSKLHYLAPMFSNLSCAPRIRKWLTEENPYVPLIKLLPFCNYEESVIRRGGAIGTLRNLSFDTKYHNFLLSNDLDLLTYLLSPLMGNEDYPDDEMDKLPIALQYLPKEKQRDADIDIRKMIIETLNQLCAHRTGREILRDNGVYYVLREYHKWEKDPNILLACENVVDILIQKEDEVGAEDLKAVEIPDDMTEKFQKMDEEYINSVK
ncbi:protein HGH1 homolog [Nymphalis io]|uniref:protein HGH1 homolog n=1 Tax=Inachis io TaxID=171585 RepID=UPI00216811AB|nr:protein HGH1 homolog [Nymphalis io]